MQLRNELTNGLKRSLLSPQPEYTSHERFKPLELFDDCSLLEALPNIAWIADPSGAIAYLNQQWFHFTGLSTPDSLGAKFWQAIHLEDRAITRQKWEKAVKDKVNFAATCRLIDVNGSYHYFEAQAKPIVPKDGKPTYWLGTFTQCQFPDANVRSWREVSTDKLLLERKLQQIGELLDKREQELEQFTYFASHDLKSPLRSISNLAQWLAEDLIDSLAQENQHQLRMLQQRVARMDLMLEGLLEYSRIGTKNDELALIDISELIYEITERLDLPADFSVSLHGEMPVLLTKKAPLEQVFTHLIDNAVKHHHRYDGNVSISVAEKEDFYQFTVTDDGMGIPLKDGDRIFNVFQTLASKDSRETAGMGLAIVKKILEKEGCEISLKSGGEKGSVFQFTWSK